MLILTEADVRRALTMRLAIEATEKAYLELSSGRTHVPLRHHVPAEDDGVALVMPGYVPAVRGYGVKFVSVMPGNSKRDLPVTLGTLLLFDSLTGVPLALVDATHLTAVRTGAGVGVASNLLARPDAKRVGIIGTGGQAYSHLEAVWSVRDVDTVYANNRTLSKAESFCASMRERARELGKTITFHVVDTPKEAVLEADIVVATTNSSSPVVEGSWLRPGTHVNAAGSHDPKMQEIDEEVVTSAALVAVDSRRGASVPGDLAIPLTKGSLSLQDVVEIGEILNGTAHVHRTDSDVTLFKSVGHASQDLVLGQLLYEKARSLSLGSEVEI